MTTYVRWISQVIHECPQQGWRHELTEKHHHRFYSPDGSTIVTAPSTPSDGNAMTIMRQKLEGAGYKFHKERDDLMAKRRTRGIKEHVRDYMREGEGRPVSVEQAYLHCRAKWPGVDKASVNMALTTIHKNGELVRLERGLYRWHEIKDRKPLIEVKQEAYEGPMEPSDIDQIINDGIAFLEKGIRLLRFLKEVEAIKKELKP